MPRQEDRNPTTPRPTAVQVTAVSIKGMELIRSYEKLSLRPFDSQTGKPLSEWAPEARIGYGHPLLRAEWPRFQRGITDEEALRLFEGDVGRVSKRVRELVKADVSQHQFDALVSLAFNIGCRAFEESSVLRLINDPAAKTPYASLEAAWKAWNVEPDGVNGDEETALRPEQFFGEYVSTDVAWCARWAPEESMEWAKEQVGQEAAILPNVFSFRGIVVMKPRYVIRSFPRLVEGDVPEGIRRGLSDFYGAGSDRGSILVLHVYDPESGSLRFLLEIIGDNTLWDTSDGPWLIEWRRDGTNGNPTPLKDRWHRGANH